MTDLRAECLAMAERGDAGALHPQEAAALLRRVAAALPKEPQGDVVEAMAKAAWEDPGSYGDERIPWDDPLHGRIKEEEGIDHRDMMRSSICAALSAAEPFIQARIAAAVETDGWQDISTAPTNRAIQIFCPSLDYYGNQGVYAGMLVDMGTGRRWMTFGWAIGRDLGEPPAAWRPLPAPPAIRPDLAGQQDEVR